MSAQGPSPAPASPNDALRDAGQACIANISPRERLKRLIGGVIPFILALAILTWLIVIHAGLVWRLLLFLPFVAATYGFFQWRDKT